MTFLNSTGRMEAPREGNPWCYLSVFLFSLSHRILLECYIGQSMEFKCRRVDGEIVVQWKSPLLNLNHPAVGLSAFKLRRSSALPLQRADPTICLPAGLQRFGFQKFRL